MARVTEEVIGRLVNMPTPASGGGHVPIEPNMAQLIFHVATMRDRERRKLVNAVKTLEAIGWDRDRATFEVVRALWHQHHGHLAGH